MILNLRCVPLCFQVVSGLNINLFKFELVKLGNRGDGNRLAEVFGCKSVQLPINYLGVPLGAKFEYMRTWASD